MGSVVLARSLADNSKVAIKFPLTTDNAEANIQALKDEVAFQRLVECEGTARIIEEMNNVEVVLANGNKEEIIYCAVFEYVDGVSVNVLQEVGKMTEDLAHFIYKSVFNTLKTLKTKGVAHRDLKPENIMVDLNNGAVKVIDFGISKKI